jgi:adenosine kinase
VDILLTGSIAFDYLMTFPGYFREHILPDELDRISLSFLVDSMIRRRGGIAANIGVTLAQLGERPAVMATVGEDFGEYRAWLDAQGVDTTYIRAIDGLFTASFFVTTDRSNAQIATFYSGGMAKASTLRLADLPSLPKLVMISANDPGAMAGYVRECHDLGLAYIYDPSQQVVRLDAEALVAGVTGSLAVFGNDYEFRLIEEKTGLSPEQIDARSGFVVITRGERGVDILADGRRLHVAAVAPRTIADPTGVGDAFRGGFLKAFVHDQTLETCGRVGALAATYCLEHPGSQGHTFDLRTFASRYREVYGQALDL